MLGSNSADAKKLKDEEMKLMDVKIKLQDQLRRLQVEELAIRSMMASDISEKPVQNKELKK